jgi:hypothetical protein
MEGCWPAGMRAPVKANGLAYASTMGWMRVEPQQRNAHPREEQSGSMNLPTSVAERINFHSLCLPRVLM